MRLADRTRLAVRHLLVNRVRTSLTILGISIGIGTIVFLVGLGFGLEQTVIDQLIRSSSLATLEVRAPASDLLALNETVTKRFAGLAGVRAVSPTTEVPGVLLRDHTQVSLDVVRGIEPAAFGIERLEFTLGRPFTAPTATDPAGAVLSAGAVKLLYPEASAKPASLLDTDLSVVVYLRRNGQKTDQHADYQQEIIPIRLAGIITGDRPIVYVPRVALVDRGVTEVARLKVVAENLDRVDALQAKISQAGFEVTSVAQVIGRVRQVFRIIEGALAGFGVIALLVALIGMFNTMTVALLERTRDIGVMKALGATRADIQWLFLIEAVIIGLAGGLGGIGLGSLVGWGLERLINYLAARAGGAAVHLIIVPFWFLSLTFGLAAVVGILTGWWPARRAARMPPLQALRYE